MAYEGYVDELSDAAIRGWIYDDADPDAALEVEVLAGERVIARLRADTHRPDLEGAGKGNGRHGFSFRAQPGAAPGGPLAARIPGKRWRIQPTQAASGRPPPVEHDPRRRFLHTLEFGYPEVATTFTAAAPSPDEARIVERLVEAFHRAQRDRPDAASRMPDAWRDIEAGQHGEVLDLAGRRDQAGLAAYLRDAHSKGLTWGITQGVEITAQLREIPDVRRRVATQFADCLASFAEAMGILDVESPHQHGQWGENLHSDPQVLVDAIRARVGFAVELPAVIGSCFGLQTRGGVVTARDLCSLHAALRLRRIAADLGLASPRVCEIGGGLGGVAYYLARMGIDCTIIDLPLVGMLQGYFLLRALPGTPIQLYGEPEPAATAIRLLPTFCFEAPERRYELLLNQDSFPEMNAAYAVAYLKRARRNVTHAFLSINQEARAPQTDDAPQTVVPELVEQAGGFRRASRHRHWLRPGYVEEIYRISSE